MSFNGSFGDGEIVDEEDNSNILFLKQDDFKINFDEKTKSKFSNIKSINNTCDDVTLNSNTNNNLFNSLFPNEMKINFQYQNLDNYYYTLLSKELLKYHLSNLFNILKTKIIIINTQTFYLLKRNCSIKTNNLMNAEILYFKISENLSRFSKIFQKKRKNILFQAFSSMKTKLFIRNNKSINNNSYKGYENFIHQYEEKYKIEKDTIINENNNNIKQLKNDIKNIEKKIENLANKENQLKIEINNILKKDKHLNKKINIKENSNNTMKKSIQISNISSISPISNYDSDINSLENTIETNKQLREGKEEIIKIFMEHVNGLINEYQEYIDNINKIGNGIKNNNIDNNIYNNKKKF